MAFQEIPTPPLLTGEPTTDTQLVLEWAWKFYQAMTQGDVPQARFDAMAEIEDIDAAATLPQAVAKIQEILVASRGAG